MAAADVPTPVFKCAQPGCCSKPFRTKSNLTRHVKSKHGPKVTMFCGEKRVNHTFNNRRHEDNCSRCLEIRSQKSCTGVSNGSQHASSDDTPPADPPAESGMAMESSLIPEDDSELPDMSTWLYYDYSFCPNQSWS